MDVIFSKILSMSLSASFVIAAVLLLRVLLRKAPKKYSYFLWLLVFFRLLCPFTIESVFSLIPVNEDAISYHSSDSGSTVKINTGIDSVDWTVSVGNSTGSQSVSGETFQGKEKDFVEIILSMAVYVWIIGVIVLSVCGLVQILRLKYRLRTAVLVQECAQDREEYSQDTENSFRTKEKKSCKKENSFKPKNCPVYESTCIDTAFLLGFFRPRIYLPVGIKEEQGYVIAHELMHKKRLDHIVKPICYLAVILHWFNPLVWVSFHLMIKDMEMSCDEQVLKSAIEDIRGAYSKSLLNLSVKGSGFGMPLAFGESNTKERIKHALKYKKSSSWIGIGAIMVLLVAGITLLSSGSGEVFKGNADSLRGDWSWEEMIADGGQQQLEELFRQLSENRNPYIGDNSADGKLVGLLPEILGYEYGGMTLQTQEEPYELTITYYKTEPINVDQEQKNGDTMWLNALFLFATIENMDICNFALVDNTEDFLKSGDKEVAEIQTDDEDISEKQVNNVEGEAFKTQIDNTTEATPEIQTTSYTREDMEQIYGELYPKSETSEGLRQLKEKDDNFKKMMKIYASNTIEPLTPNIGIADMGILNGSVRDMDIFPNNDLNNNAENDDETDTQEEDIQARVDSVISQAILDYMKEKNSSEKEFVEAHVVLGGEEAVFRELSESDTEMEFYLIVQSVAAGNILESSIGNNQVKVVEPVEGDVVFHDLEMELEPADRCFPAKVTIHITEEGSYELKDFWVPANEASLGEDVKEVFPEEFREAAISMEGYQALLMEKLKEKGYKQLN